MIPIIKELVSIFELDKDGKNGLNDDRMMQNIQNLYRAESLSSKTKSNIKEYPLIISDNIDPKVISNIRSYLSDMLRMFCLAATSIESDLDPSVNSAIRFKIDSIFSTESDVPDTGDNKKKTLIVNVDDYKNAENEKSSGDKQLKNSNTNRKNSSSHNKTDKDEDRKRDDKTDSDSDNIKYSITVPDKKNKEDYAEVRLNFSYKNFTYQITVIILVNVHPVNSDEMKTVLSSYSNNAVEKNIILNYIKYTTGEINLLKDYLIEYDKITKKRQLKEKLGRTLFYNIFEKKNKNKVWNFINLIKNALNIKTKDRYFLPTSFLAFTTSEIKEALGYSYSDLIANKDDILKNLCKEMYLLGIVIYDDVKDVYITYFDGFDTVNVLTERDIKQGDKSGDNKEKKLLDILLSLARR